MLRSMKDMEDYAIGASDGLIGRVKDYYFDDEAWVILYLVVQTEDTSPRRKVLISPIGIGQPFDLRPGDVWLGQRWAAGR